MLIGYARVSTDEQTLDLQLDALREAGCGRVFSDTASGAKADRAGLVEALEFLRDGDTLVVWRLDRLGRSLGHLIETMVRLEERGISFKSISEQLDTATSGGKLVFHLFGALAEFERNLIRDRTHAGLTAARLRGRVGGRPRAAAFNTAGKVALAEKLHEDSSMSIADICETLRVSRATLYRYLKVKKRKQDVADELRLRKEAVDKVAKRGALRR